MPTLGPYGFRGGMNTKASSWTVPKDSMTDSQNVNIVWADIVKRKGCAKINSTALNSSAVVTGLFDWLINSGTRYLLAIAGTKIFNSATLSSTFNDISGAATITAGQNNQHTFASLNNIVAICGGTTPDTPLQWTGAGNVASLAGSPPVGNLVCVANNFMFISGVAATPSRVYWSNASDPGTWGASNFIDFRVSDGDGVTSIIEKDQNLYIFKRRSIGILFTQTNTVSGSVTLAPLTEIVVGIGCPGGQCTDLLPDGRIAFLGTNNHVYILNGTSPIDISDPPEGSNIQPSLDAMNFSRLTYSVLKVYPTRNQIWLSMSSATSTTNDTIFVYDYQLNVWISKFTNLNANVMEQTIDPRTTPSHPIIMVTGDYGGFVYEQDTGNTDATVTNGNINGYGTVSILLGPDKTNFQPKSVVIPLEAQSLGPLNVGFGFNGLTDVTQSSTVSELLSGGALDSFVLDTDSLAGSSSLKQTVPVSTDGRIYSMQIQVSNNGIAPFTVHPIWVSDEIVV